MSSSLWNQVSNIAIRVLLILGLAFVTYVMYWAINAQVAPKWMGFGPYRKDPNLEPAKTLWDWLDLMLAPFLVSLAVAFSARWLNRQERKTNLEIAADNRHQAMLEKYLEFMTYLMEGTNDQMDDADPGKMKRTVARVRTLTVLRGLDPKRRAQVLLFLNDAGLISGKKPIVELARADLTHLDIVDSPYTQRWTWYPTGEGQETKKGYLVGASLNSIDFRWSKLNDAILDETDLTNAVLAHVDLRRSHMHRARLYGASLKRADLRDAKLTECYAPEADFREAKLIRVSFQGSMLRQAWFDGADLRKVNLTNTDLRGAYLRRANLRRLVVKNVDMTGADLSGADLRRADLRACQMSAAKLVGTNLRNASLQNVSFCFYRIPEGMPGDTKDRSADFTDANLVGADLSGANLVEVDLSGANLRRANLSNALLAAAQFTNTDLRGANLRGARLTANDDDLALKADQAVSLLNGARLKGAILPDGTVWRG